MPAIQPLAKECGVSESTVRNILGSKAGAYSAATRSRVEAAARQHGYQANRLASSLRSGRSNSVAVLVPDLGHPYYAEMLGALSEALAGVKLDVMLGVANWRTPAGAAEAYRSFLSWRPRAFMVVTYSEYLPYLSPQELHSATGSTVVVTLNRKPWADCPAVTPNQSHAAELAVEHLTGLGHRRIGMLGACARADATEADKREVFEPNEKVSAVNRSLQARGLSLDLKDLWCAPIPYSAGHTLMNEAEARKWFDVGRRLAKTSDRPTALLARSEPIASWFIAGFMKEGGDMPGDISVVTFGNTLAGGMMSVPLTAVGVPMNAFAEAAIDCVQQAIAARERGENMTQETMLDCEIVIRDSTGPKAGG